MMDFCWPPGSPPAPPLGGCAIAVRFILEKIQFWHFANDPIFPRRGENSWYSPSQTRNRWFFSPPPFFLVSLSHFLLSSSACLYFGSFCPSFSPKKILLFFFFARKCDAVFSTQKFSPFTLLVSVRFRIRGNVIYLVQFFVFQTVITWGKIGALLIR